MAKHHPPILTDCPPPPYAGTHTHFTQPPQSWTKNRAPRQHYTPRHTPSTRQHISNHRGGKPARPLYPSRVKITNRIPRKTRNYTTNDTLANGNRRDTLPHCKEHHPHRTKHTKNRPPQPIQHRHNSTTQHSQTRHPLSHRDAYRQGRRRTTRNSIQYQHLPSASQSSGPGSRSLTGTGSMAGRPQRVRTERP